MKLTVSYIFNVTKVLGKGTHGSQHKNYRNTCGSTYGVTLFAALDARGATPF